MHNQKRGLWIFLAILSLSIILAVTTATNQSQINKFDQGDIAVVTIQGTISVNDGASYDQQWLLDTLDTLTYDANYQGLLLYINTPGGNVYQCDEVYLKLKDYQDYTGNPIYVSMGPMAASGGYYIAAAADQIYANRNTLTGSIGVIMGSAIDLTDFLSKHGIKVTTITAGANKNMFNFDEPVTQQQRAIMQSIADGAYQQFVQIVAQERGFSLETALTIADGRIYTAKQALDNHLIDGIADFETTTQIIADDLQLANPAFDYYHYDQPVGWLDQWLLKTPLGQSNTSEFALLENALRPLADGPAYYYGW